MTIVFNADGSITITPAPADFVSGVEGVIGSAGNDTIRGNGDDNFLGGGGGDDNITGNNGDDCVVGGDGNDILNENNVNADGTAATVGATGNGADALDGGPGADDTVDYSLRTNRTLVHLGVISWFNDGADPNANAITDECDDVFFTTENAITGLGNDILSADYLNNQSDNELTGGPGNDQLEGGAGNDVFHEGSAANGADAMEGDAGADTADYSAAHQPGDRLVGRQFQRRRGRRGRQRRSRPVQQRRHRRLRRSASATTRKSSMCRIRTTQGYVFIDDPPLRHPGSTSEPGAELEAERPGGCRGRERDGWFWQ